MNHDWWAHPRRVGRMDARVLLPHPFSDCLHPAALPNAAASLAAIAHNSLVKSRMLALQKGVQKEYGAVHKDMHPIAVQEAVFDISSGHRGLSSYIQVFWMRSFDFST